MEESIPYDILLTKAFVAEYKEKVQSNKNDAIDATFIIFPLLLSSSHLFIIFCDKSAIVDIFKTNILCISSNVEVRYQFKFPLQALFISKSISSLSIKSSHTLFIHSTVHKSATK
ncbi:MAG: hypothetical protein LBQ24_04090 [Candidatus Peribacteria bacterium]|jgi:hypothetical protein|nr:hypothetical protein [Candidatus Peribacteria bacterium]